MDGEKEGGGGKFDRTDKSNVGLNGSVVRWEESNQIGSNWLVWTPLSLGPRNRPWPSNGSTKW